MDAAAVVAAQSLITSYFVFALVIYCASYLVWALAAATIVFFLLDRRRRFLAALSAFSAASLAWLVNQGIGELFFRPRPFADHPEIHALISKSVLDKSFPSDHAALSFALAFAVFQVDRRWGAALLAAAAVVSSARVFAGVHYPTDILGGAFVGIACAYLVHCLIHALLRTEHHPVKS